MKIDLDEVGKSGFTLEQVLTLLTLELTRIGQPLLYSSTKDEDLIILYQNGLLNSDVNGYTTTKTGRLLIGKVLGHVVEPENPEETKKVVLKFDEFWEKFPGNDQHGNWMRTRTLKSDKAACLVLYKRAVTGGVKHEDLIKALEWEVKDRKARSTLSNKMSFMKASSAWLRQREYDIILDELANKSDEGEEGSDSWVTSMV